MWEEGTLEHSVILGLVVQDTYYGCGCGSMWQHWILGGMMSLAQAPWGSQH